MVTKLKKYSRGINLVNEKADSLNPGLQPWEPDRGSPASAICVIRCCNIEISGQFQPIPCAFDSPRSDDFYK
jgi:hypothetical protein